MSATGFIVIDDCCGRSLISIAPLGGAHSCPTGAPEGRSVGGGPCASCPTGTAVPPASKCTPIDKTSDSTSKSSFFVTKKPAPPSKKTATRAATMAATMMPATAATPIATIDAVFGASLASGDVASCPSAASSLSFKKNGSIEGANVGVADGFAVGAAVGSPVVGAIDGGTAHVPHVLEPPALAEQTYEFEHVHSFDVHNASAQLHMPRVGSQFALSV